MPRFVRYRSPSPADASSIEPPISPTAAPVAPPIPADISVPVISTARQYNLHPKLKWREANFVSEPCLNFISSGVTLPSGTTPLSIFEEYFLTRPFLNKVVFESNIYSRQTFPNSSYILKPTDVKKYLGILIYHSIVRVNNTRDYWSPFVGSEPIRQCLTLNQFEKIRSILHFNDNNAIIMNKTHPKYDRLFKLRPVLDHFNESFGSVAYDENLSIDENVCATKAKNSYRQYNPKKPHKWGYKFLMICNTSGYVHKTEIYSGQENQPRFRNQDEPDLGACANIVVRLTRDVPKFHYHKLYFDNYYTSLPLMAYLKKERGILSVGTIRKDRTCRCTLFGTRKKKIK